MDPYFTVDGGATAPLPRSWAASSPKYHAPTGRSLVNFSVSELVNFSIDKHTGVQAYVLENFPNVFVDWDRVNQAMAQGPPSAAPLTKRQMTYVEMEQNLRSWARRATILPSEKTSLLTVAEILYAWRCRSGSEATAEEPPPS